MALLFGSTWLVNSAVFFTVLVLILLANLYVLKVSPIRLGAHYATLFIFLAATVLVPFDAFLSGGVIWRYIVPCVLALGPMFYLTGTPWSEDFMRQYAAALDGVKVQAGNIGAARTKPGSFDALCFPWRENSARA